MNAFLAESRMRRSKKNLQTQTEWPATITRAGADKKKLNEQNTWS